MPRRSFALYLAGCACAVRQAFAHAAGGEPLDAAAERFAHLARALSALPPCERAAMVNLWVNQLLEYASDLDLCGLRDCWQTPAETLASGRGDCEDFAIAKYFLLEACSATGCPRLVCAHWTPEPGSAERLVHVVVVADAQAADPAVLDCLGGPMHPLSRRTDLRPLFSFDARALWRGVGAERLGDAATRLLPWRGVLGRWAGQQRAAALLH